MKGHFLLSIYFFLLSFESHFSALSYSTDDGPDLDSTQSRVGQMKTVGMKPDKSILSSGLIGITTKKLQAEYTEIALERNGFCSWYGTSPFCKGFCPYKTDLVVRARWPFWMSTTFGSSCWSGKKSFCCKRDLTEKRWAGKWKNTYTYKIMWCSYLISEGPCGAIKCMEDGKESISNITGNGCNEIRLFGNTGTATSGSIRMNFIKKSDENLFSVPYDYTYEKYGDF